jgi:hypothetical protein
MHSDTEVVHLVTTPPHDEEQSAGRHDEIVRQPDATSTTSAGKQKVRMIGIGALKRVN